jgi:hypothetical protein
VPVEGLSVCEVGVGLSGFGGGVVPASVSCDCCMAESCVSPANCQGALCEVFKISWICAEWRNFAIIVFPELFALVEAHCGVFLLFMLGFFGSDIMEMEMNNGVYLLLERK